MLLWITKLINLEKDNAKLQEWPLIIKVNVDAVVQSGQCKCLLMDTVCVHIAKNREVAKILLLHNNATKVKNIPDKIR